MKLILVGDWHLRSSKPSSRIDDFVEAQYRKTCEIFELGYKLEATIIQTGDLFDRSTPPYSLINRYLKMFTDYNCSRGIYVVPGNHDIYGASLSTLSNSSLFTFAEAGAVNLLSSKPIVRDKLYMVGTSYFDDSLYESPVNLSEDFTSILVSHEMVLQDKMWSEQEDFIYLEDYTEQNPYWNIILCGHYHYRFSKKLNNSWILNPGAVVRIKASKGDMNLKPGVGIYDTVNKDLNWHYLKCEPSSKVFFINNLTTPVSEIDTFVDNVKSSNSNFDSLSSVVVEVFKSLSVSSDVQDLVRKSIVEVESERQCD